MQRAPLTLWRRNDGIAAMEFALCLPILLILFVGVVEISRYAIIQQKLAKTADTVANLATLGTSISTSKLNELGNVVAPQIMSPYAYTNGTLIFTSAGNFNQPTGACSQTNQPCIVWQYRPVGSEISRVGVQGTAPTLPNNYQVAPNQNVITSEIFYNYAPLLPFTGDLIAELSPKVLYRFSMYKPRQNSLTVLN